MINPECFLALLGLGAVTGFLAGLLGIGGGGVLVPFLVAAFLSGGVSTAEVVHLALGTSMACMVFSTIASYRSHRAKGAINSRAVKGMAGGVIAGTFSAAFLASFLSSTFLAVVFVVFMTFSATQMFLGRRPRGSRQLMGNTGLFAAGSGIGALSALVSIGGGSLTVPFLAWQNVDIKTAIGTSAAIGLWISVAGTLGYVISGWDESSLTGLTVGHVYLPAVAVISTSSFVAAPYGAQLAHRLPVSTLKKLFGALLVVLSLRMLANVGG